MQIDLAKLSPTKMGAFLDQLRHLVQDEATVTRQNIHRLWSEPIPIRVAEGHAIEAVRLVRMDTDGYLHLSFQHNLSRFREGDTLCLNRGNPFDEPSGMVTLEREEPEAFIVSVVEAGSNWVEWLREPDDWMLDEGFVDLSSFLLDALDQVGDTTVGRERILPLLMDSAHPSMDVPRYERGLSHGEVFGLNWSQGEALAQAYATDLAYLIQGPPGTGKTRVLAHLAQLFAEEGERVLISAATHRAINNALNKVAEVAPDTAAIKIGRQIHGENLAVENYEYFDTSPVADMSGGYVIGATPFALRTRRLNGVEFETVIFDEASQITLPLAIMSMLAAKKYILIGDHKQLPPVFQTFNRGNPFWHESVFGLLAGHGFETMLTETFRLNAELAEWPSRTFYNGELVPVPAVARRRLHYARAPERWADILDSEAPRLFLDLRHRNSTTHCRMEASVIAGLVQELLSAGIPAREIGIVTPYRAQAREIRNHLQSVIPEPSARREIVTDTVERLQGQERDVILLSLTTSNPTFAANLAEFFFQPERLNVAVTRARKKLIIVGSSHVLNAQLDDPELAQGVALLRDLLQTCTCRILDLPTSQWHA